MITKNNNQKSKMISRLNLYGLSIGQSIQVAETIERWIAANGVEWTVSRLKQLKVAYIHRLAGYDNPFKNITWIAYHKDGSPKGCFRPIFLLKNAQKALGALMVYSQYVHTSASSSQVTKFKKALSDPDTSNRIQENLKSQFVKAVDSLGKLPKGRFHKLSTWVSRDVSSPSVSYEMSSPYLPKVIKSRMGYDCLKLTSSHPVAQDFLAKELSNLPETYQNLYSNSLFSPTDFTGIDNIAGNIGLIQEPGLKLRTVANPFSIFQVLLSRMGDALYQLLETIEEDATFDQDKSVREVQERVQKGENLMAIDLSSATDRFPVHFTESVLGRLGVCKNDLELFKTLSRLDWQMPDGELVQWKTGQPLGVYPSFAAFALSHHALVRMVEPRFYRILGDDMIIDYESGVKLRKLYEELSLPISEDKSLISNQLGEFGGRLVTSDKILVQPKWREISDRSFVDLIRVLGPRGVALLRPRQRKVVKILAEIPEEVCSYGLGWNPKGKSYQLRLDENKEAIEALNSIKLTLLESVSSKNSYRVGESMVINQGSDFKVQPTAIPSTSQIGTLEQQVLENRSITKIDTPDDSLTIGIGAWFESSGTFTSDPRGDSTLTTIERKLKRRCILI